MVATKAVCRSADLAKRFAVSPVTVHKIVERLRLLSLVTGEPYQPIELTAEGMEIAGKAKERHQIVFEFLVAIGIDEATAAIDSEGIEHHVSPKTLEKLKQFSLRKIGAQ